MNLSLRVRLTAWYTTLLAAIMVAIAAFLVLQLQRDLRRAVDTELTNSAAVLTHALADLDGPYEGEDWGELAEEDEDFLEAARAALPRATSAVQLLTPEGDVLAAYGSVAAGQPLVDGATRATAAGQFATRLTARIGPAGADYRIRLVPVSLHAKPLLLLVGTDLAEVELMVDRVLVLLLVAGPVVLLAAAVAGYWLAGKGLRPVARMTSDAQGIGAGSLDGRVAVPRTADELRELALTLNAMLARIERGTKDQRRLVADASHELRSPLAVMRTEIDVSLRRQDLPDAARAVLSSAGEEVDRMRRTVDNLLTLAESDEGGLPLLAVPVSMSRLLEETARPFTAVAAAHGLALTVEGGPEQVQADPQQLRIAAGNLLDNAVKFTPAGGTVTVRSWQRDGEVGVTVTDDGPGLAPEEVERVFDRFYRVDPARGRAIAGSGLGLSICKEIALAHGGRVWVESRPGHGSAFSLALPAWRTRQPDHPPPRSVLAEPSRTP